MHSDRPEIRRRPEYVPQSDQERFIVPLLKEAIESELERLIRSPSTPGVALNHFESESKQAGQPISPWTFRRSMALRSISLPRLMNGRSRKTLPKRVRFKSDPLSPRPRTSP